MQNTGHQQGQYQGTGGPKGYPSAPAVPPPYGATQGYQSATPHAQNQWAPPAQSQPQSQQQWSQPHQHGGGYNPGVYGTMPGGYSQSHQTPSQIPAAYQSQQQDQPPPPPPKPAAFAAAVQAGAQSWGSHTGHGSQQDTGYLQGQQGGFAGTGGYQGQAIAQQSYNTAMPQSASQTPGGPYYTSSQMPQAGDRPGSVQGADNTGTYSTPSSAFAPHPLNSSLSPNEHNPVYVPPSLNGQGVQSYVPANTNPLPGVYVPQPPDVPAWQQASHAPLQGEKKFKYTKPAPASDTYGQVQGQYAQQSTYPPQQYTQDQYPPMNQVQPAGAYGQPAQNQEQQNQYGESVHPQQSLYGQTGQPAQLLAQAALPYQHLPQVETLPTQPQPFLQQQNEQHLAPQNEQGYGQPQTWQPGHQTQATNVGYPYVRANNHGIEVPRPVSRPTGTTPPGFVDRPSPQSQPVSPIQTRISTGFNYDHPRPERTDSVSSIALGAIHAQRAGNRTQSPRPTPQKLPTHPPPRDDAKHFRVLGAGGPSDWEHFGGGDEVDDEELFKAKRDGRQGVPVQLDSVEVSSQQVSPPQSQGQWPTPPVQPASIATPKLGQYQPTPPPTTQHLPSPPPTQSPIPSDAPPLVQTQSFVFDDATVQPLQPSQPPSQHATPSQKQPRHPPPVSSSFSATDHGTYLQQSDKKENSQVDTDHAAEIKLKDEALDHFRSEAQKKELNLLGELEELKVVIETTKAHAEYERKMLADQLESMKTAAEQSKSSTDASEKEKDLTIERWKEDSEGKEDTIKEKDEELAKLRDELRAKEDTIAQGHTFVDELRKQLEAKDHEISNLKQQIQNNQTAEGLANDLKQQLEAERLKDPPKPTPAALIPDLDPWYAGSLERYITMLRNEAQEAIVEDKIRVFTGFLKAESSARGLDNTVVFPPQPPSQPSQQDIQLTRGAHPETTVANKTRDLNVQIPLANVEEDDIQYSPGGRPVVQHRPIIKAEEFSHRHKALSESSQSIVVLTPTSSQDESTKKTPTPMQSPPIEVQAQLQYKAYVPSVISQSENLQDLPRQSASPGVPLSLNPTLSYGSKKDEVFFGADTGIISPSSRPGTSPSAPSDVKIPAPLFTQRPVATAPRSAANYNPTETLTKILPVKIGIPQPNPQIEAIRKRLVSSLSDPPSLREQTIPWEKTAVLARKRYDEGRRKRQEESEEHTDQLFNDHEISYADIAVIEDEFKEKERKLKADEDRAEYQSYVEVVFDKVYDGLQQQLKRLMDLYIEAESLLPVAVSGIKSLQGSDAPTTAHCLKLLEEIFKEMEQRHEKVVEAVAERDKRYKKTEIQPLYAAGDIAKMKQIEKHFANAEKEARRQAHAEQANRVGEFVRIAEGTVIAAVGVEQEEIQSIITAVHSLPFTADNEKLRTQAKEAVFALGDSSRSLLLLLNDIEIDLGGSSLAAELAEAKTEKQSDRIAEVEKAMLERIRVLKEEYRRKEAVLDQDRQEIEKAIKGTHAAATEGTAVAVGEKSEEELKKERLSKALENAKRRNGDL